MTAEQHYAEGREDSRLTMSAHGRLEFLRIKELLGRVLPEAASVLDVGGGTGVHAAWLAAAGHAVHVIDPVPAHVAAAALLPGVTAEVGDARRLPIGDASVAVVLLMGPLYHLTEPDDRAVALAEAYRVLRPGGVLAAAAISRYMSVLEAGSTGVLTEQMAPAVRRVVDSGYYDGHLGFVPTHFHTAEELGAEVGAAGFAGVDVFGVQGPSWHALDMVGLDRFDSLVESALLSARLVERDPLLINASAHLLALARR